MIYYYNDTPIFYEVRGNGTPWVLLHGYLENASMWSRVIDVFAAKHTIITIDLPGFGKSGSVGDIHTMEDMARIVAEILDVLQIETATLIGHSMGGYVTLAFTELFEERVETLVLLNSTPSEDTVARKTARDRGIKLIHKHKKAYVHMAIHNLFTRESHTRYSSEIADLVSEAEQLSTQGIKAAIMGMGNRKNRVQILERFSKPKYMISGTEDPIMPIENSELVSEKTNTPLFKIESGHMSWLEDSTKLIEILHLIDKKEHLIG